MGSLATPLMGILGMVVVHMPLAALVSKPHSLPSRMWLLSGPILASKNNLAILKPPALELFSLLSWISNPSKMRS